MDILVLALFCLMLLAAMLTGVSLLYALLGGLILFSLYANRAKGIPLQTIGKMCLRGMLSVRKLLLVFLLIGFLTGLWRQCGTIAEILCLCSGLFSPRIFLPLVFLLNCLLSYLTGTSFGTAATMGVITVTLGKAMGIHPAFLGGAMLSGAFFGDRCSPLSTSAMLVRELTDTEAHKNIRNMLRTGLVPFLLSLALYTLLGFISEVTPANTDITALFSRGFSLHILLLLPAVLVLALSLLRVPVIYSMLAGIGSAFFVAAAVQKTPFSVLIKTLWAGYSSADAEINAMLSGGGLVSMLSVTAIVCLSCAFSELFEATGLLNRIRRPLAAVAEKRSPYTAMLLASLLSGAVACNQTLSIILTARLCASFKKDSHAFALSLEDTAVLTSVLYPWSIACSTPLSTVGAPALSILFAFYLYLVPVCRLLKEAAGRRKLR